LIPNDSEAQEVEKSQDDEMQHGFGATDCFNAAARWNDERQHGFGATDGFNAATRWNDEMQHSFDATDGFNDVDVMVDQIEENLLSLERPALPQALPICDT
jgi:hypothetical protein